MSVSKFFRTLVRHKQVITSLVLSVALVGLVSCSQESEQQRVIHQAVAIENSDECHLCGMLISNFDGPKAQLFRNGVTEADGNVVKKFCSTRDMFSFYLDPENKRNVTSILVHDMSKVPWGQPDDKIFIDARTAWFVIDSSKKGAMGKTLASFSTETDANAFAAEFGGKAIHFDEITYESL